MRVNIENDLEDSGRLAKFCRLMKWGLDRGMGRMVRVYRDTQHAEIVAATREEIVAATVVRANDATEASRVIDAMIGAQLADLLPDGQIFIRGNEKHVCRLARLRQSSLAGGLARGKQMAATRLPITSHTAALLTPYSYTPAAPDLSPNGREGNAGTDLRANPAALALEAFYLGRRKGSLLTRLPPSERVAIDELLCLTGNPQAVLENYLGDEREYYKKRKWPLSLLVQNIGEHDGSSEASQRKRTTAQVIDEQVRERASQATDEAPAPISAPVLSESQIAENLARVRELMGSI